MTMNVEKVNAYVAVQVPLTPGLSIQKAAAYVAVLNSPSFGMVVEKATAYVAVMPDTTGDGQQIASAQRPIYRAGPIPYIQFTAGTSLTTGLLAAGTYTLLLYKPNGSITQQTLTLATGQYTLPTTDFNQAVLVRSIDKRILRRIKLTFPLRV